MNDPQPLDDHLFACRHMWEQTQDPIALIEALEWVRRSQQLIPSWLEAALVTVLSAARSKAQTERHADDERHAFRWLYVRHFRKAGATWDAAYARTVEQLEGTWAEAGFDAVKKSYAIVQRALKEGHISRFQIWGDRHLV
jgi:hypothetical protein